MRNIWIGFFIGALGCGTAWGVDVRTSVADVYHEGSCELLGSFTLAVTGNAFQSASPDNPIYIRFRINQANFWSRSLVDMRDSTNVNASPINLCLSSEGSLALNPALPAGAVQLVRFIKGEREGWIRVNYPTSSWLWDDGNTISPSAQNVVNISLGISGFASIRPDGSTATGGNEFADGSGLASTEMYADYQNTPQFDAGDLDELDFIAFHGDTLGVETGNRVVLGSNAGVTFSNDNNVARGAFNIARFEYHIRKDDFDSPPHEVGLNRLNSETVWSWCGAIPSVFYTNTSDFPWHPGTVLFLCPMGFDPACFYHNPSDCTGGFSPDEAVYLWEGEVHVQSLESSWTVEKLFVGEDFVGYSFHLDSGQLAQGDTIQVDGIKACMPAGSPGASLFMSAYAYIYNDPITEGDQVKLGPRTKATVNFFVREKDYHRMVLPFTAYDHPAWRFSNHVVNRSDVSACVTSILFNRHGVALRVLGQNRVPAHGKHILDIASAFGEDAESVLSWIEVLSDQPIAVLGQIDGAHEAVLDCFAGQSGFSDQLIGAHVPSVPELWETTAYVLASDLDSDAEFYLKLPQSDPSRLRAIMIPGATAVLHDQDFASPSGRASWFEVQVTKPVGSGLIFFEKREGNGHLTSAPLDLEPSEVWAFDHLGRADRGWWNGLVLMNPEAFDAEVTVSGLDDEGVLLAQISLTVPASVRQVGFVESMLGLKDEDVSRLTVTSSSPLVALVLLGLDASDQLTSIQGNLSSGTHLLLPYLPESQQMWTGLVLVNPGEDGVKAWMRLRTASGSLGPEDELFLLPGQKQVYLLESMFGDMTGYTHLEVESEGGLRGFALLGDRDQTRLATVNLEP